MVACRLWKQWVRSAPAGCAPHSARPAGSYALGIAVVVGALLEPRSASTRGVACGARHGVHRGARRGGADRPLDPRERLGRGRFPDRLGAPHELTFVESPDLGEGLPCWSGRQAQGRERPRRRNSTAIRDALPLHVHGRHALDRLERACGRARRRTTRSPSHASTAFPGRSPDLTFHPRSVLDRGWLDRADSALTSDRVVELESMELHRKYKLEARDEVRTLACARSSSLRSSCGAPTRRMCSSSSRTASSLVAVKHHLDEQAPLDALLDQSRAVLARLSAASASADRSPS